MPTVTNLLQWFDVFYRQKNKAHWTTEVVSLWEKISWWAKFLKNFLKKVRQAPWMEEGVQNLLAQIGSRGVLWIPSTTNVPPLLSGNNQGSYDVVLKVLIERFDCIPNTIELVGKTLKTDDKQKVHK